MEELQIYSIVNSVVSQATGRTDLTVTGTQGLVSLGRTVLDSATYTDDFLDTLVKRIGKTIVSYRAYTNTFKGLMKDSMEWGAIVQKLKVVMPVAEEDESYGLTDGSSVDHYVIAKPEVKQKLFITDTPYQFKITVQREHLKEAFTSAAAMGAFITAIYGEVQNAIELALENLGRTCLNNMIAEASGSRVVNLRTTWNALVPTEQEHATAAECLLDGNFLRWAVSVMKQTSTKMTAMSQIYNDGSVARHTPKDKQNLFVLSDFETTLETQVSYSAFHDGYVNLDGYIEVPFWQDIKTPFSIDIARASDNSRVQKGNVVAVICDKDALGMFQMDEWTATTPFNAAGGYTNTYYHEKQLWFNDLSENFVVFTLD